MSDQWVTILVPLSLLCFYPLVWGIAQLRLVRENPQLARKLHLGGWGLTILLISIFITWNISLRGQWLDVLPFGLGWLAAGVYFWLYRPQLRWLGKLYFGGWFCYPACLALAYVADKIFFILVAIPILAFFPSRTHYSDSTLTIRDTSSGFLAPARVQALTPRGLLVEKHEGWVTYDEFVADFDTVLAVRLPPQVARATPQLLIITSQGQHQLTLHQ